MRLITRLFVIGSLSALGALAIDKARQRRAAALPRTPDVPKPRPLEREHGWGPEVDIEDATIIAETSGLADVDPQPLTHTAGEGIVPDEDERARDAVQGRRGMLPRSR